MSLGDLVKNNPVAILTLLGTVCGVVITQAANLIAKGLDYRNNLKTRRLDLAIELEKKYLIEPVVLFIDKDLKAMQKTYAQALESEDDKVNFILDNEHVFELSSLQARVKGLCDSSLNEKFEEFSGAKIRIGTSVSNGEVNNAYKQLDEAIKLAGEILELLFKRLRKIEN
jgi:hypothetical protein